MDWITLRLALLVTSSDIGEGFIGQENDLSIIKAIQGQCSKSHDKLQNRRHLKFKKSRTTNRLNSHKWNRITLKGMILENTYMHMLDYSDMYRRKSRSYVRKTATWCIGVWKELYVGIFGKLKKILETDWILERLTKAEGQEVFVFDNYNW